MMRACPKCGAYYADDSLAFCLSDGTPLVNVNPSSERWNEGSQVIKQKAERLRKQKRTLKWRWIVASAITALMLTLAIAGSFTVETTVVVYKISGRVTSESKPLSNVKINLEGSKLASVWTDANGYYTFSDLPVGGSYTITPLAPMSFKPSSRVFNNLRSDESADFFIQNDATPTPTPTPTPTTTPTPECSEADQISALKSLEPGWRGQLQREQARIIKENAPDIEKAEAGLERIDFQYSFPKPCATAMVTVIYTWRVSWPATPVSLGKSKNVTKETRFICRKLPDGWSCPPALW